MADSRDETGNKDGVEDSSNEGGNKDVAEAGDESSVDPASRVVFRETISSLSCEWI